MANLAIGVRATDTTIAVRPYARILHRTHTFLTLIRGRHPGGQAGAAPATGRVAQRPRGSYGTAAGGGSNRNYQALSYILPYPFQRPFESGHIV